MLCLGRLIQSGSLAVLINHHENDLGGSERVTPGPGCKNPSNHRRTAARIDDEAAEKQRQETHQEMRTSFTAVVINGFLRRSQLIPGKTRIRGCKRKKCGVSDGDEADKSHQRLIWRDSPRVCASVCVCVFTWTVCKWHGSGGGNRGAPLISCRPVETWLAETPCSFLIGRIVKSTFPAKGDERRWGRRGEKNYNCRSQTQRTTFILL